jgi:hypothetical protein
MSVVGYVAEGFLGSVLILLGEGETEGASDMSDILFLFS